MIVVEFVEYDGEKMWKVYGNDRNVDRFFKNIENQRKDPLFNICWYDEVYIQCFEENTSELSGYLEHHDFQKAREGLYYKD